MSQAELANVGKFVLALFGYFIGTGVFGIIIAGNDMDAVELIGWVIGGLAFATLMLFVQERSEKHEQRSRTDYQHPL